MIDEILEHNRAFVARDGAAPLRTGKYPKRRLAIVTCMDTRLCDLLPAALGIKGGDAKVIRIAGGVITDPLGEAMRSVLVAVYELGVESVLIIGHTGCGVQGMESAEMLRLMRERGVAHADLLFQNDPRLAPWLTGFQDIAAAVRDSVQLVRQHPLMPKDVRVSGFVIDTETGELRGVED